MSGALDKALDILQYLTARPDGVALAEISTDLNLLRTSCHRTLHELIRRGYVRQMAQRGDYALTIKLASLGLSFLGKSGIIDVTRPPIERLARISEELVRLAIRDGERLTLVAKAQGRRSGVLYDPDMGIDLTLSCSAAGHAWLMTLPEDKAIEIVSRQGLGRVENFGPAAPTSIRALLDCLEAHRERGFSIARDMYARGMSSMAAPVQRRGETATGVVVVAGPSIRLSESRMLELGPELLATASELALAGSASPLLKASQVGTWGNRAPDAVDGPDP